VLLQSPGRIPAGGPRVGVRAPGEELGQLLRALARPQTDPDRMERMAFIVEVSAVRVGGVRHETGRAVTILLVDALDPQVGRLAHARIGGDPTVARHLAPPSAPLPPLKVPRKLGP